MFITGCGVVLHGKAKLLIVLAAAIGLITGCGNSEKPSASREVAAQGLYTGAISDHAQLAVVGSLNHGASLWNLSEHARLYNWSHTSGEPAELVAADFSPDGSRAVTTDPRTLVMWDTRSGKAISFWGPPGVVLDVAILSDNRRVLLGLDDHSALLFDARTGDYLSTFLHKGEVGAVATDSNSRLALSGSDDHTAVLWSMSDGRALQTYQHDNPVRAVAISAEGSFAFTAAQGDLVAIWDNASGRRIHELHNGPNHGVITARFSEDERLLAVGYANHRIELFDVASGALLQRWDSGTRHRMRPTGAAILEVAFAENQGYLFALTGDGRLLELRRS